MRGIQAKLGAGKHPKMLSREVSLFFLSPSGKYTWAQSEMYYDTIGHPDTCSKIYQVALTVLPKPQVSVITDHTIMHPHCTYRLWGYPFGGTVSGSLQVVGVDSSTVPFSYLVRLNALPLPGDELSSVSYRYDYVSPYGCAASAVGNVWADSSTSVPCPPLRWRPDAPVPMPDPGYAVMPFGGGNWGLFQGGRLWIYDVYGRVIAEKEVMRSENVDRVINDMLRGYPRGPYWVKLVGERETIFRRIVFVR